MAKVKSILASHIIKEHFGDIIEKVASYLIQNGQKPLKDICKSLALEKEEVSVFIS